MWYLELLDFYQVTNVHFDVQGGNSHFPLDMFSHKSAPHFHLPPAFLVEECTNKLGKSLLHKAIVQTQEDKVSNKK
jgi:hypothetical protein